MKKNFWNVLIALIGLGLLLISIIMPNPEVFGLKAEWLASASLILLAIKQFIERSGLLTQDEANQQTSNYANNMTSKNVYLKNTERVVSPDDVEFWRVHNN